MAHRGGLWTLSTHPQHATFLKHQSAFMEKGGPSAAAATPVKVQRAGIHSTLPMPWQGSGAEVGCIHIAFVVVVSAGLSLHTAYRMPMAPKKVAWPHPTVSVSASDSSSGDSSATTKDDGSKYGKTTQVPSDWGVVVEQGHGFTSSISNSVA